MTVIDSLGQVHTAWRRLRPHLLTCEHILMPCRSLTYEAPSNELLEALTVLVRYATVFDDPSAAGGGGGPVAAAAALRPAQGVAAWLPLPPVASAPPGAAGKQSWRPPPRLGAAGSPSAQV